MPYYWDLVLTGLKESRLNTVSGLFTACINLCEKYADRNVWECFDRCHDRFNVAKVWTLETV
jgi:hypothetical protein